MKPARILVVDDQPGMLRAVERVLGQNHQVIGTTSSRQALELASRDLPDLAILDIRMPDLDGFDLLARLKKEHPGLDVILMTGSITEIDSKLVRAIREKAFYFVQKPFDREVLITLVDRCLEQRRLAEENRRHLRRLENELAEARAFQQSLLPPEESVIGAVTVCCRYVPCSEVGGDFCDYASAGNGRAVLLIADVSGHGASAAMLTGIVKSAFHAAHADGHDPLAVVRRISRALRPFPPDRFVTMICARVHGGEGRLEYVNAGHPPPYLWTAGGTVTALKPTGPIISPAFDVMPWRKEAASFPRGARVLLYTDGITEAPSGDDFFGAARLLEVIGRDSGDGASLLDGILDAVKDFSGGRPQPDDLTLLTARME